MEEKYNILILDKHMFNCDLLAEIINISKKLPCFVNTVPEAKTALKICEPPMMIVESYQPDIKEFIVHVSENHKKVKTILTTTFKDELEEYKHLYKTFLVPYKPELMLAAIEDVFQSEKHEEISQGLDVN